MPANSLDYYKLLKVDTLTKNSRHVRNKLKTHELKGFLLLLVKPTQSYLESTRLMKTMI